jgi:hypothetical protein
MIRVANNNEKLRIRFCTRNEPEEAAYLYSEKTIFLRRKNGNDLVVFSGTSTIEQEKESSHDTCLFHELIHFYHCLIDPIGTYLLQNKVCIGTASYLCENDMKIHFHKENAEQLYFQRELRQFFPCELHDSSTVFAGYGIRSDLVKFVPFLEEVSFKKISGKNGFKLFKNCPICVNMEDFFTIVGSDCMELYKFSENAYRNEKGKPLRYSYSNMVIGEPRRIDAAFHGLYSKIIPKRYSIL